MAFIVTTRKLTAEEIEANRAEAQRLADLASELSSKCSELGIPNRIKEDSHGKPIVTISIEHGRRSQDIDINSGSLESVIALPLEEFKGLDGIRSLWIPDKGTVELPITAGRGYDMIDFRKLFLDFKNGGAFRGTVEIGTNNYGISAKIDKPSVAHDALFPQREFTLQFSGFSTTQHDAVRAAVRTISNSFFFDVYCRFGIAISLSHYGTREPQIRNIAPMLEAGAPEFPKRQYDEIPLSLFWNAEGLWRIPLFCYLAYYQVVEYYFTRYWALEARNRIRNVCKDPTFSPESDEHIDKIVDALAARSFYGDEESQLLMTIRACVGESELRRYILDDSDRSAYFKRNRRSDPPQVNPDDHQSELCKTVAHRIYDLRCRIVHAKSNAADTTASALYPESSLTLTIPPDIELMRFVSKHVLIASNAPLVLNL